MLPGASGALVDPVWQVEMAHYPVPEPRVDPDSTLGQMKKHAQELIQIGKAASDRPGGVESSGDKDPQADTWYVAPRKLPRPTHTTHTAEDTSEHN